MYVFSVGLLRDLHQPKNLLYVKSLVQMLGNIPGAFHTNHSILAWYLLNLNLSLVTDLTPCHAKKPPRRYRNMSFDTSIFMKIKIYF